MRGWSVQNLVYIFIMFPDSCHHKKYNGSCFMYLSEILSKLQMCKVTIFLTFY